MPAQTRTGQIDVPVFRMLGSDPIYQYGIPHGMFTLEPVYPEAGGSAAWAAWFLNNLIEQPSLAFAYTQAGQENSFGWNAMKTGLTQQVALLAAEARAGTISVQTLAQTGQWFRDKYSLTPPTAVVALEDWKHESRKTVWYNSRFYRLNILWQKNAFFIRDLHCFDENMVSPTHDTALTANSLAYYTLPIVDQALWSSSDTEQTGMWPVLLSPDGSASPMTANGSPVVKELNPNDLSIHQPLSGGGTFTMVCAESNLSFTGVDERGRPLRWAWHLAGGAGQNSAVQVVTSSSVHYSYNGMKYRLQLFPGVGSCQYLTNGAIQLNPDSSGKLVIVLNVRI